MKLEKPITKTSNAEYALLLSTKKTLIPRGTQRFFLYIVVLLNYNILTLRKIIKISLLCCSCDRDHYRTIMRYYNNLFSSNRIFR